MDLDSVPALPGAETCARSGWLSSLHPQNKRMQKFVDDYESIKYRWELPLLVDPQTSPSPSRVIRRMKSGGGLMAFVPEDRAEACLLELQAAGMPDAAIIGRTIILDQSRASVDPSISEGAT